MIPIETERKFLIRYPDISLLESEIGVRIKKIEQTYLLSAENKSTRVRKICEDERIKFVKTIKERISVLSVYEDEFEIDEQTYNEELKSKDPEKNTITKTNIIITFVMFYSLFSSGFASSFLRLFNSGNLSLGLAIEFRIDVSAITFCIL